MSEKKQHIELADITGQDLYVVVKRDDVERLDLQSKIYLSEALEGIKQIRKRQQKPDNTYWIVNQDEPYADSVKALIFGLAPDKYRLHRAAATLIEMRRAIKLDLEDAKKKGDKLRELQAGVQLDNIREAYEVFGLLAKPYLNPRDVIADLAKDNTPRGEGEEG